MSILAGLLLVFLLASIWGGAELQGLHVGAFILLMLLVGL